MALALVIGLGTLVWLMVRGSVVAEQRREAPTLERRAVGTGARSALVVRRRGAPPQRAVVFLHGWRLLGAEAYRPWLMHLARQNLTVIAPRYQARRGTPPDAALDNAVAGIRAALDQVAVKSGGVVVVGHSAGGALAADYAAIAAQRNLPRARAVLAIYPGRVIRAGQEPIPLLDLSQIPSTARLVVMASTNDEIVGDTPARELWQAATAIPPEGRRFVWVRDPVAADHFAPALGSRAARRVFWTELDRLVMESG